MLGRESSATSNLHSGYSSIGTKDLLSRTIANGLGLESRIGGIPERTWSIRWNLITKFESSSSCIPSTVSGQTSGPVEKQRSGSSPEWRDLEGLETAHAQYPPCSDMGVCRSKKIATGSDQTEEMICRNRERDEMSLLYVYIVLLFVLRLEMLLLYNYSYSLLKENTSRFYQKSDIFTSERPFSIKFFLLESPTY